VNRTLLLLLAAMFTLGAARAEECLDGYAMFSKLSREEASMKAAAMASTDFQNGTYRILVYGMRRQNSPYEVYLWKIYGVSAVPIAGCIVSEGILGAADGYNSTMKPLLNQKFGRDIFKEAEEARP
jgi:hypothetical protein